MNARRRGDGEILGSRVDLLGSIDDASCTVHATYIGAHLARCIL